MGDFRELDSWRQARTVVCALLTMSSALSQAAEHAGYAHGLHSVSIGLLDNMARGYEGDRKSFLRARLGINRLEELIRQGQARGLLKVSESMPLRRELRFVRLALEDRS